MIPGYKSAAQAAASLDISVSGLYKLIAAGRLHAERITRTIAVADAEIERYRRSQGADSTTLPPSVRNC